MKLRHLLFACLVLASTGSLFGCAQSLARSSSSASLGKIIEPVQDSKLATQKTPLALPVSVAILAIPSQTRGDSQVPNTTLRTAAEKLKQKLLANPKYVNSVTVVEQDDAVGKVSLDKIRKLYGADVAIIMSYHQDQRSVQPGFFALMDATLVGAFLVPGVEIQTVSVIDGKVVHLPSNAIIFRASGTNEFTSHSTSYATRTSFTEASIASMVAATDDFGNSLTKALNRFDKFDLSQAVPISALAAESSEKAEASAAPANDYWKKVDTYKTTGGGAFGIIPLLIAAATCCAAWRRN